MYMKSGYNRPSVQRRSHLKLWTDDGVCLYYEVKSIIMRKMKVLKIFYHYLVNVQYRVIDY